MSPARKEPSRSVRSPRVSGFAQRLLMEWKHLALPAEGDGVVIAVSGGADSTALLLAFDELSKAERLRWRVTVAHLDHGLRGAQGERDARWVADLTASLGLEVVLGRASVRERARSLRDNLEQAARRARYEFLTRTAQERSARLVLTAHTLDDQAETILLGLLRGSGTEGLGGMRPVRTLGAGCDVLLVRPLLRWARRADTEGYCQKRGVTARVDEMNEDERFARVRVRRNLVPLLEGFNPRAAEALARTADLLREDSVALEALAAKLLDEAGEEGADGPPPLLINVLANASPAVRKRALRQWVARGRGDLRRMELVHIVAIERLLTGERGGRIAELPGGSRVERRRGRLWFHVKKVEKGSTAI